VVDLDPGGWFPIGVPYFDLVPSPLGQSATFGHSEQWDNKWNSGDQIALTA